jgi:sarcosine oxidase
MIGAPTMSHFDVVVCGLGITGSAALYALARRGVRVLGVERFAPGHERGSSHGETRVIRLGYFEHPSYVPLVRDAYARWRDIEKAAATKLLHATGTLEIGAPTSMLVEGSLTSIREHKLPYEVLGADELMHRFPAFRIPADYIGVLQPEGGYLRVEASVTALVQLAQTHGAEIRVGETVGQIVPNAGGVRIATDRGLIDAGTAIVSAGAWVKTLLPELPAPIRITRQVMAWFEPVDPSLFDAGRLPVFLIESRHGVHYGFPPQAGAIKVAKHHHADQRVDPETYDRTVSAADEALIRAAIAEHLPAASGRLIRAKTCIYTRTRDDDFIIDRLPQAPQIVVGSPCSGHGFKFAPVIGEVLADLATTGATPRDISRFALARFAGREARG